MIESEAVPPVPPIVATQTPNINDPIGLVYAFYDLALEETLREARVFAP
jgi:hypothetical protein